VTLTRQQLDQTQCENERCEHVHDSEQLFLLCATHPERGLAAVYNKPTGELLLFCMDCGNLVVTIEVAKGMLQ
jgi:hypothetical protein